MEEVGQRVSLYHMGPKRLLGEERPLTQMELIVSDDGQINYALGWNLEMLGPHIRRRGVNPIPFLWPLEYRKSGNLIQIHLEGYP